MAVISPKHGSFINTALFLQDLSVSVEIYICNSTVEASVLKCLALFSIICFSLLYKGIKMVLKVGKHIINPVILVYEC